MISVPSRSHRATLPTGIGDDVECYATTAAAETLDLTPAPLRAEARRPIDRASVFPGGAARINLLKLLEAQESLGTNSKAYRLQSGPAVNL